jgi:hypothetical protein
MYPYQRAEKNDHSVKQCRESRFYPNYPGFEVDVLDGYGFVVRGNTRLGTVRDTYLEE